MNEAALDTRVLKALRTAPKSRAAELADELGEPVQDVSAALRRLRVAGFARSRGNTKATRWTATP